MNIHPDQSAPRIAFRQPFTLCKRGDHASLPYPANEHSEHGWEFCVELFRNPDGDPQHDETLENFYDVLETNGKFETDFETALDEMISALEHEDFGSDVSWDVTSARPAAPRIVDIDYAEVELRVAAMLA